MKRSPMRTAYAQLSEGERAFLAAWEKRVRALTEFYGSREMAVESLCEASRHRATKEVPS